jgi:NAD(P)-dependent dehydrogenase (short-subunit alcohol dehydrogenase family)
MDYRKDKFQLIGKTAIVTGGLGILGRRFCAGLAAHGADLAVVDLDGDAVLAYAKELGDQYGTRIIGISCDITDSGAVAHMVDRVVADLGEIAVLHNNAAWKSEDLDAFFAPFEEYDLGTWRQVMSVNLDGLFLVAQAVGRQLLKQGRGGSVIQTSSIYGMRGPDHRIYEGSFYLGRQINTPAVYSASKGAVNALTRHLATLWANDGIRVNTLTPGGVESGQNEDFKRKYSARVPLNRMAQPGEMVGALVFLASDASSYVTGQNLVVDGGLSAW